MKTKFNISRVWRYQRVIKIRKSKDRQHNGQKKKDKQRSTKHTHKTKDRVTRTPLKAFMSGVIIQYKLQIYIKPCEKIYVSGSTMWSCLPEFTHPPHFFGGVRVAHLLLVLLLSYYVSLRSEFRVAMSVTIST